MPGKMDIPPKITQAPAKIVPLEVLPSEQPRNQGSASDPRPIHALSALILITVDSLWTIFDWLPPIWIVAIPLCFLAVFVPCFLIQRHLKGDSNGRALAFATVLGV